MVPAFGGKKEHILIPICHECSKEAADNPNGGSTRPAEAREPKPTAEWQAKEPRHQQHPEPLRRSSLIPSSPIAIFCRNNNPFFIPLVRLQVKTLTSPVPYVTVARLALKLFFSSRRTVTEDVL
jgi:hypothetical protein